MIGPWQHAADTLRWVPAAAGPAHTTATSTAIWQVLLPPYTAYQSAQTTEAGVARQQAARVADPSVVDGDTVYRLLRLNATEGHAE